jgi:hypothetical protein
MKLVKLNGFVIEVSKIESKMILDALKEFNNPAVVSIDTVFGKIERM